MPDAQKAPGRKTRYSLLAGLLALASGAYATLFYAAEAMSERDYSGIKDPQLRVGYCMMSSTSNTDKYLLAETTIRSPDIEIYRIVMPYALAGAVTLQKRAALMALRERDELRTRAVRLSFSLAEFCDYRNIAWPKGTTPLDVSFKWLRHDSTFRFFLEKVKAEPDAAARVYDALGRKKPGASPAGAQRDE
jgi:hypothetical protein